VERVDAAEVVINTNAAAEVCQVRTAAHADMLAVIDRFTSGGIAKGPGAAA
jgi:hypothetical protein